MMGFEPKSKDNLRQVCWQITAMPPRPYTEPRCSRVYAPNKPITQNKDGGCQQNPPRSGSSLHNQD
ncbi:hypothetical protein EYF80_000448 [Liparis tanakae]|uniref:Uncharacterized protein n=1 Tax=Liparis tanakae TaxID=230148 RepID=A0A4Z2JG53_9TELE|nr:hypothetical protein EYF80_000448 [Liparis tanakae]